MGIFGIKAYSFSCRGCLAGNHADTERENLYDVHIWSIGYGTPAFSADVFVNDQKISEIDSIRNSTEPKLRSIGMKHAVIQMECIECEGNELLCRLNTRTDNHCHE